MTADSLPALAGRMQALADADRLRILLVLRGGALSVCQIAAALDVPASTISSHLVVLGRAGVVGESRRGRFVWYSLRHHDDVVPWLRLVARQSTDDSRVRVDFERATRFRLVPPEILVASIECETGVVPIESQGRAARRGAA